MGKPFHFCLLVLRGAQAGEHGPVEKGEKGALSRSLFLCKKRSIRHRKVDIMSGETIWVLPEIGLRGEDLTGSPTLSIGNFPLTDLAN